MRDLTAAPAPGAVLKTVVDTAADTVLNTVVKNVPNTVLKTVPKTKEPRP